MQTSRLRRLARPNKLHRKSLLLFGSALALQCVILLSTVPGTAQQIEPRDPSLCVTNCVSINVETAANIFVSHIYTTTFTIDTNPVEKTVWLGELSGAAAEFLEVEASRGQIDLIEPVTFTWSVDPVDPVEPGGFLAHSSVITTTIQAAAPGVHTQSLFPPQMTNTPLAAVETATLVTDPPLPFALRYRFPALGPVGVITDTYFVARGSEAISTTVVTGRIESLDGRYLSVVGSGAGSCDTTDLNFTCTLLFDRGALQNVITATFEVAQPAHMLRALDVSGGGVSLPLRLETATHPIQLRIDIKPGGFPNTIRIGGPHDIPVAILSRAGFQAVDVDVETLAFGPTGHETSPTSCAPEFSNSDVLLDLVCHFDGMKAGFKLGDEAGNLTGRTLPSASFATGLPIAGQDSVRIIDPGRGQSHD